MTGRPRVAPDFQRILDHCGDGVGRLPYQKKKAGEVFSTEHMGQRKLLLSEIELLNMTNKDFAYTAVYAGAAPGIHIPFLAEMFPHVTFHLYDPRPFQIAETERIKLHCGYFTDSTASTYADIHNLIFVCDIRRTIAENEVWEDMLAQQKWHEIMQPELTMLKFRLPWVSDGESPAVCYLDGDIYLPVWGRTSTTECRLVVDKQRHEGRRLYDCKIYEEEMSYFNRITRPSVHGWQNGGRAFDACYDCTAERRILEAFLVGRFSPMAEQHSVYSLSGLVSMRLGRRISFRKGH